MQTYKEAKNKDLKAFGLLKTKDTKDKVKPINLNFEPVFIGKKKVADLIDLF